jgi:hypothetical protein
MDELCSCFVAFADILGYRDKIKECDNNYDVLVEQLKKIREGVKHAQELLIDSIAALNGNTNFFSDSVFLIVPIHSTSPREFDDGRVHICLPIEDLAQYQFELSINDIFLRGCATVHYAFIDKKIAFGPGILDVIECEEKCIYPRVCLSDDILIILRHYCENKWPGDDRVKKYIYSGYDGKFFINYLYTIIDYIEDSCSIIPDEALEYPLYQNIPDSLELITQHRDIIQSNLEKATRPNVKEKFIWLVNYHNFFCREFFAEKEDLLIKNYSEDFFPIS